jgi:probable HAF family extracellular repeat protein
MWAADINNRGEITGWGFDSSTGETHAFLAVHNRMHDGSIPDVQSDSPAIAPRELPDEVRQRLARVIWVGPSIEGWPDKTLNSDPILSCDAPQRMGPDFVSVTSSRSKSGPAFRVGLTRFRIHKTQLATTGLTALPRFQMLLSLEIRLGDSTGYSRWLASCRVHTVLEVDFAAQSPCGQKADKQGNP